MRRIKADTTLIGVSELRTQADAILKVAREQPVIVEKRHKPVAVLMPVEQYNRTEQLLDALEDTILGLLAKERERRAPRKGWLTLEQLEHRVSLRS